MTYSTKVNTTHEPADTVAVLYSGHMNRNEIIVILNLSANVLYVQVWLLLYLDMYEVSHHASLTYEITSSTLLTAEIIKWVMYAVLFLFSCMSKSNMCQPTSQMNSDSRKREI